MTATGARSPAADETLAARFRAELDRLCPFWLDQGKVGLAVSGGPDSIAMLLLADAAIPEQFEVATVDHGLRPNSVDECAFVAEICAARSVPCAVLKVEVAQGNVQASARTARYEALGDWADERGLSAVATAHHADDQAETFLMRLNRGSGLAGLAGIRETEWMYPFRTPVVRPFLEVRKEELAKVVAAARIEPIRDPSNIDERFDRARIRRFLAECEWIDPLAVARSASLLGEAQRGIERIALEEWEARVFEDEEGYSYCPRSNARSVEIEIVSAIIQRMSGKVPRSDVARLIEQLRVDRAANLGGVLARLVVESSDDGLGGIEKWVFRPEPARRAG